MPTLMSAIDPLALGEAEEGALRHRHHGPGRERQRRGDERGDHEHALVGAVGDHHFLQRELDQVGEGLEQAPGAHHVGPAAHLHGGPDLAVGPQQIGDDDQQARHEAEAHDHEEEKGEKRLGHGLLRGLEVPHILEGRAFGHGLRRAGDRIGHVEIGDGERNGSWLIGPAALARSASSPVGAGVRWSMRISCGATLYICAAQLIDVVPRQRGADALPTAHGRSPSPPAPRPAGRRRAASSARGLRC